MRILRPAPAALALILCVANTNAQTETARKPGATDQAARRMRAGRLSKDIVTYEDTGQPAHHECEFNWLRLQSRG